MAFATRSKEGEEPSEKALVARLRQFVEDSDLSFYKIASRIGTSGGILSLWLAGTARPRARYKRFLLRIYHYSVEVDLAPDKMPIISWPSDCRHLCPIANYLPTIKPT